MAEAPPKQNKNQKKNQRKLVLFALGLGAMSLFMYVSFIIKTAVRGP